MLVQALKNLSPLALLAPEIPGALEPQSPAEEWGINLAAAQLNFPDKGLKVQIPIWSNKSLGDKVELLLNNNVVDQHTISDPVELTERATLFVAPFRLQTGPWTLSYRVTRLHQQPEPFTPPLKLYVKLDIPGGQDTDPDYGHSNLSMAVEPAEIVLDGVDKDSAKNGVDILIQAKPGSGSNLPYPNIALGDVITASWGIKRVLSAPVTQAQIDNPVANPIKVHVDEQTILDAKDSGPEGLAVTFMVRDRVHNQSEDWCKETRIVVDTGNSRLDAPILKQANGNVLDLDTLGEEKLILQAWAAASTEFKVGDVIIMNLKGTTLEGEAIDIKVHETIKNVPSVVEVLLSNAAARALAKTQGVFSYELERAGVIIQRSKGRFINIVGEPKRLAAPIAEDAQNGALDPELPNTRIRIPFDPLIQAGMAIELKWFGKRPDQNIYDPELERFFPSDEEAKDPEGFLVTVEGKHLKTLEGGTLELWYTLLSDEDDKIVRRESVRATLLNVGEPKLELVKPIVLGEKDGALEPKDLPGGVSKVTCPNPVANPTKSKDMVTWQLRDANGALLIEDSKTLNSLNAGKAVDFPLNSAFVQQHFEARRGEKLSVSYQIWREATNETSYSNPLEFVVGEAVSLDPPTIESVKGSPSGVEIPNNTSTVETAVTLSGTASKGQTVEIFDGSGSSAVSKGTATANATTGIWEHTITVPEGGRRLYAQSRYHPTPVYSNVRNVTVVAVIPPTLTTVTDSKGPVPDGGITVDTALTLKGKASKNQRVKVLDHGVSQGERPVDNNGDWTTTGFRTTVGEHSITIEGLYGNPQPVSVPRTFTVTAVVPPTIGSVKGSPSGVEIPNGTTIVETAVTLSGTASKGQRVDVLDGTDSKGQPMADVNSGIWTLPVSGLTVAPHSFTAKALYGSGAVSAAWKLTVVAAVNPTIRAVNANTATGPAVPNGTSTTVTTFVFTGKASASQLIELRDNNVVKAKIPVNAAGNYSHILTGQAVGAHSYTVKATYGSFPESAAWKLTVTGARIVEAWAGADKPHGRLIRSGDSVSITAEPGVRFYLADVPSHHTSYYIFHAGSENPANVDIGPLGNPPVARAWKHVIVTDRYLIATGNEKPEPPSGVQPFVINWTR